MCTTYKAFSIYLSLRKEVIQPHLPVRLPCYDFTLLTKRTFGTVLLCRLDKRLAHAFINFVLEPTVYAEFLDTFGFPASIHTEAGYYQKKRPHYALDDLKDCILKQDLGKNLELYNGYWQRIRFTP